VLSAASGEAAHRELANALLHQAIEASGGSSNAHWLPLTVFAHARHGEFEAAEAILPALSEPQRAELLGVLTSYLVPHGSGGLAALEGLLGRHPGALERAAILKNAAVAQLSRAGSTVPA
jgi:hypothetical protein